MTSAYGNELHGMLNVFHFSKVAFFKVNGNASHHLFSLGMWSLKRFH